MTELLGTSLFWIVATLGVLGLIGLPTLRAVAMLVSRARLAVRALEARAGVRSLKAAPERPLELTGLTPGLAELALQTRHLARELHRYGEQAATWPTAGGDEGPNVWSSFVGSTGFGPQIEATREVWDWLRSVERLSPGEREQLVGLGVEADAVRELLLDEQAPDDQMRALAGLLRSIDGRLTGGNPARASPRAVAREPGVDPGAAPRGQELRRDRRDARHLGAERVRTAAPRAPATRAASRRRVTTSDECSTPRHSPPCKPTAIAPAARTSNCSRSSSR